MDWSNPGPVTDLERHVQAWFSLGVDVGVSFLALSLVTVPTFALADTALATNLDGVAVAIALALALTGTFLSTARDWSLARLSHFVGAYLGSTVVWLLLLAITVVVLELPLSARDPLVLLVAWLLALATAAVLVYYGDDAFAE